MAGHSKWANIKHRKYAQDARRARVFTRLIREVHVAARLGAPTIEDNPRLRLAVDRALSHNVPKDNIERAIKRAAGEDDERPLEELRYEGYGPGGIAIMVDCMTDNRNRTVAAVRHAFNKYGGKLGTDGSVAFLFTQRGVIGYPRDTDEDRLMEAAVEVEAIDVVTNEDGSYELLTEPDEFVQVRDALRARGLDPEYAEVTQRPDTTVSVEGEDAQQLMRLLEVLEDIDDVQNVYSNAAFAEDELEAMA